MSDLVKIGAAFSFIVALLRLRWNLGLVMFAAALFLGTRCRVGPFGRRRSFFYRPSIP